MRLLSLIMAMSIALISMADAKEADKSAKEENITLASFKISGAFPETTTQVGLFGELEEDLRKMIARIHRASEDDDVTGIVLKIRSPMIGRGKIDELREAVTKARKAGKTVYADLQSATSAGYLIACACDEIVMPPSGMLMITGVRAEVTFFQQLFNKLGVKADFIQVGDFKGAAEPFTRSEMSPEFRKQYESLLDDVYDQMINTIAEGRKLDASKVKELIDEGLFTADKAKKVGLIDRVAYDDQWRQAVRDANKASKLSIVRNYGKKKLDTDFSGFTGMIKLMNLMMGIETTGGGSRNEKVAVVYAVGAIMTGESEMGLFSGSVLGSDTIVKALRKADEDKSVKAIVLRVDSPGGSAVASDQIWREIIKIEKPIIASMGDVAASGGYYISMGAEKIFAEPGTLTGSIGVVGGKLAMGGMFDKIGVTTDVISRGKNSGIFSMNEPFSASERKAMQQLMQETYRQFTTKAAEGRKMKVEQLEKLAQGKVYTGRQAQENGLIDELGTLRDAIAAAKKAAGLGNRKVELLILPKPKSIFEQVFGGPSIETRSLQAGVKRVAPELAAPLGEVELLRRIFAQPVNTILPYRVRIR